MHFKDAHVVRKELGLKGSSVGKVTNSQDKLRDFAGNAVKVLRKKYGKAYPGETMILCAIFPDVSFGFDSWYHFFHTVANELSNEIKYKTFLLDTFTGQHHILNISRF